jgi:hypothetical protein
MHQDCRDVVSNKRCCLVLEYRLDIEAGENTGVGIEDLKILRGRVEKEITATPARTSHGTGNCLKGQRIGLTDLLTQFPLSISVKTLSERL